MADDKRKIADLTVDEAYVLYKIRSNPELWKTLNRYIKPDGSIRTEVEAAAFNAKIDGIFKIEE